MEDFTARPVLASEHQAPHMTSPTRLSPAAELSAAEAFPCLPPEQATELLNGLRGYIAAAVLGDLHPFDRDAALDEIVRRAVTSRASFDPSRAPLHFRDRGITGGALRALKNWLTGIARRYLAERGSQ
jgi:hypothetical protein